MTAVLVELKLPSTESDDLEFVEDLDVLVESSKCSCNAGDDNPYWPMMWVPACPHVGTHHAVLAFPHATAG